MAGMYVSCSVVFQGYVDVMSIVLLSCKGLLMVSVLCLLFSCLYMFARLQAVVMHGIVLTHRFVAPFANRSEEHEAQRLLPRLAQWGST